MTIEQAAARTGTTAGRGTHRGRGGRLATAFLVAVLAAAGPAPSAEAGMSLEGEADNVKLEIDHEPLQDVLARISSRYKVQFKGSDKLAETVSGSYRGKLEGVIAGLLSNHNHMLSRAGAGLTVTLLDGGGSADAGDTVAAGHQGVTILQPPPPTLSPEGRRIARQFFGDEADRLQIDEKLLRSYAAGRASRVNTRDNRRLRFPSAEPTPQ